MLMMTGITMNAPLPNELELVRQASLKEAQEILKNICIKSPIQIDGKTMRKCLLVDESDLMRMGKCLGL